MTKYLTIATLITGFLAGNAYGEDEVYYCATTQSVGFSLDKETGEYKPTKFDGEEKFTLKHKRYRILDGIEIKGSSLYEDYYVGAQPTSKCTYILGDGHDVTCLGRFHMLNFSYKTMKFVLTTGYGYVASGEGSGDIINMTIGKCEKF
jgi:hypothetical protein